MQFLFIHRFSKLLQLYSECRNICEKVVSEICWMESRLPLTTCQKSSSCDAYSYLGYETTPLIPVCSITQDFSERKLPFIQETYLLSSRYLCGLALRIWTSFWRREDFNGLDMWNAPVVQSRQPLTYRLMESMGLGGLNKRPTGHDSLTWVT